MARRIKERKLKNPTVTIIGEGATERYYFTHLKRLRGYNYICKPRNFAEQTFDEMQKQIDRVVADEGVAVCVLCDSMPSIELWFLIHFLNTNRYFATSDEVISVLRRYIPNFSKHQSFLSKETWVLDLLSDNRLDKAISNSKAMGNGGESYTHIPKLFELL